MNYVDPAYRKTVIIEGVKFTLRPLNGADRIWIGSSDPREMLVEAAKRAVVKIDGAPFETMTVADFSPDVIREIAVEVQAMSKIGEDTSKNSVSARGCSSESSPTPTANACSTSEAEAVTA